MARSRQLRTQVAQQLEGLFIPTNLADIPSLRTALDTQILKVNVDRVDFSNGPLPCIWANMEFSLQIDEIIADQEAFIRWQDENDFIDSAIVFQFKFVLSDGGFPIAHDHFRELGVVGPLK